jgi:hypothetical protein
MISYTLESSPMINYQKPALHSILQVALSKSYKPIHNTLNLPHHILTVRNPGLQVDLQFAILL